jgi:hypothetical protein
VGRWDAEVGVGRVAVAHWAAASLMDHVKMAVGYHATNDPVGAGVDGLTGATVLAGDQPDVDELATYGGDGQVVGVGVGESSDECLVGAAEVLATERPCGRIVPVVDGGVEPSYHGRGICRLGARSGCRWRDRRGRGC